LKQAVLVKCKRVYIGMMARPCLAIFFACQFARAHTHTRTHTHTHTHTQVLEHVGLSVHLLLLNGGAGAIDTLCAWQEADLHRLVAVFLAARFPILLALNKVGTLLACKW
jgi:hypothetical protein